MSKYTADEVEKMAVWVRRNSLNVESVPMLRELASRLRQEEEENRRDPVMEPRPGDVLIISSTNCKVFVGNSGPVFDENAWRTTCEMNSRATIIRRREVQQ